MVDPAEQPHCSDAGQRAATGVGPSLLTLVASNSTDIAAYTLEMIRKDARNAE